MDELHQSALNVIKKIQYLTISSITPEGLPWGSPVYTSFDAKLHFYWLSWKENQHSINVRNNSQVFITICDTTAPAGTGVGVYLQGIAEELHNPIDMIAGLKEHYTRSNKPIREAIQFMAKYPRRIYRFTPERAWINGEERPNGNYIDKRIELNLSKLTEMLNAK
jgi:uncharacterized protein YhbP (UPF0306 family)